MREFLKEFGTIVLGVLVALGAEQTVEALHRQAEVREARAALHAEVGDDISRALFNQRREVCGARQLDRYFAWANGAPLPPTRAAGAQLLELHSTSWDVVKAGPVTAMPLKERLAFASFYAAASDYNTMMERERGAGIGMAEYTGLKRFTPEETDALARNIAAMRMIGAQLIGMADGIQRSGAETGARPASIPKGPAAELDIFCHDVGVN